MTGIRTGRSRRGFRSGPTGPHGDEGPAAGSGRCWAKQCHQRLLGARHCDRPWLNPATTTGRRGRDGVDDSRDRDGDRPVHAEQRCGIVDSGDRVVDEELRHQLLQRVMAARGRSGSHTVMATVAWAGAAAMTTPHTATAIAAATARRVPMAEIMPSRPGRGRDWSNSTPEAPRRSSHG